MTVASKSQSLLFIFCLLAISFSANSVSNNNADTSIIKSHAIAMHGKPKYQAEFARFNYTSPNARKGGAIRFFSVGTFDSLNSFIIKGTPASQTELLYDSLTVAAMDEPFTQYGLLAHTIEYPKDRSWVIFHLREKAHFHDGHPITAEDVVFTFNLLMEKGNPAYRFFYADVENIEALSTYSVRYTFKNNENRELLASIGSLPVLPKHFWQDKEFDKSSLAIPLGSGPYKIKMIDPGRRIHYERVTNYWGRDLAVNNGFYNFDDITIDYYRDHNIAVEALKAGEYDFRREHSSKFWATAYDIPAVRNGLLVQKEIPHKANGGMQAFAYNLRNPIFQDIQLRKAISYAFDFEWSNKTLFYDAYKRSYSFFTNSDFAATELPDEKELKLLLPFKDILPKSVFNEVYAPPVTDGSGRIRPNLRIAKKILDEAGYKVKDNQLFNSKGEAIRFEILLRSPGFERIVNPFIKNLARLGVIATIRLVDSSQYVNRLRTFSFDMVVNVFVQSESPGNEQRNYWGSNAADTEGSDNLIGIKNPAIDHIISEVVAAETKEQLAIAVRALDRVLLHHYYAIPQWYINSNRLVYWDKFGRPETAPIYDKFYTKGIYTWWSDPEKEKRFDSQ